MCQTSFSGIVHYVEVINRTKQTGIGIVSLGNNFITKMRTSPINAFIIKFLQDKKKYRKRRAKISADISARLFRVTCDKVSGILIHKD